ncbi:MAG: hypothetical protein EXR61_03140 [Chloroflexi bacterium]|nr:hypothetical protein [Chloroflexota bacterium]
MGPNGQAHGPGTTGGGNGAPHTLESPCNELCERAERLLQQLEGLHAQNRYQTQRALRAFYGDPRSKAAGGYAHWFTQAKVTEAVVDANNAVGKTLIDVGLFALGGWGGIGKMASAAGKVGKLEKVFGTGLAGAESVLDAYGKVALKVGNRDLGAILGAQLRHRVGPRRCRHRQREGPRPARRARRPARGSPRSKRCCSRL